ncbi:MAG TPA: hypothetical protein VFU23_04550 [Gemmatimonadales bacterium]|nr:hypothetical protein [Gemmatimonadales bacterium]
MIPTLLAGLLIGGAISAAAFGIGGAQAAFGAAVFSALGIVIQLSAIALIRPVMQAAPRLFIKRWGLGMGLRVLGVVALALAVGLDPTHFPPIPAAIGFLGVVLPLLLFEVRLVR